MAWRGAQSDGQLTPHGMVPRSAWRISWENLFQRHFVHIIIVAMSASSPATQAAHASEVGASKLCLHAVELV